MESWKVVKVGRGTESFLRTRPGREAKKPGLANPVLAVRAGDWMVAVTRSACPASPSAQVTELVLPVCPPRVPHIRHGADLRVCYLPYVRSRGPELQREMTEAPPVFDHP